MISLVLTTLLLIIYFDSRLLRREDGELFKVIFRIEKSYIVASLIVLIALLIIIPEKERILSVAAFIILLPVYLVRRHRFLSHLKTDSQRFLIAADCFSVILYWMLSGVVISVLINLFLQWVFQFESELAELLLSAMGSSAFLIYLIYKASRRFSSNGFLYNVSLIKRDNSLLKLVILPALAGILFAVISGLIIFSREVQVETPLSEIIGETQSFQILLLFVGMAVLVAPLIEEIVFRGYFFHVLKELRGLRFAIILTSLSFAFLHVGQYWGDWAAILMITVIGFTLSGFRTWTNSTIASSMMHYAYNGGVIIIPIVMMAVNNPSFFRYQIYYDQISNQEREALLMETLNKDPNLAEGYYELAILYSEETENFSLALKAIDNALSIYPDDHIFLQKKAEILEEIKRYPEALEIRNSLMEKGNEKEGS